MELLVVETPELGDRSYLVSDGAAAVVIDPQRDLDRTLGKARERGWSVELVLETHLHNDYVTGGLELARRTGARYVVAGGEEATYDCLPARDGEVLSARELRFRVLATPGHTVGHCAYLLQGPGGRSAVFTGGSMLFGTVGRTDLVSPELTRELTRHQHRSVRRLASEVPGSAAVHPTHGFGSFCASASGSGATSSTIATEAEQNLACTIDDEERFAAAVLSGLGPYPAYYSHMGLLNRAGPPPLDLSPPPAVEAGELRSRLEGGEWLLDLRGRRHFAAGHLAGTVSAELDPANFTTYVGWAVPWGTPLTLLGETAGELARAQRQLARIGMDRPAGAALLKDVLDRSAPLASYPVAGFPDLREALDRGRELVVVDVRGEGEWAEGHIPGAWHHPFSRAGRSGRAIPPGELWVHCQSGYRASLAASLLSRAGRQVVLVDGDFSPAEWSGAENPGEARSTPGWQGSEAGSGPP